MSGETEPEKMTAQATEPNELRRICASLSRMHQDLAWLVAKLMECKQICIEGGDPPHPACEGGVAWWAAERLRDIQEGRDPRASREDSDE